jgi:hypothetical protein
MTWAELPASDESFSTNIDRIIFLLDQTKREEMTCSATHGAGLFPESKLLI